MSVIAGCLIGLLLSAPAVALGYLVGSLWPLDAEDAE